MKIHGAVERTEGLVEWVSDDGQRVRVRWFARRGFEDHQTTEVASDLRKLASAA